MTLAEMKNGSKGLVLKVETGKTIYSRLASMGIFEGVLLSVIKNNGRGPIVIGIEGSRFALGRVMAEQIVIQ